MLSRKKKRSRTNYEEERETGKVGIKDLYFLSRGFGFLGVVVHLDMYCGPTGTVPIA